MGFYVGYDVWDDKDYSFYVRCVCAGPSGYFDPLIAQSPLSGLPGSTFTLQGTGFVPNNAVTLHFRNPDGTEEPTQIQATDSNGGFVLNYSTAGKPVGVHTWWAIDSATGVKSNEIQYRLNRPPTASDDSTIVHEDTTLNIPAPGVLDNDTDDVGEVLTAVWVSGPSHGALTLGDNGSFTYTPFADFNGADSFTYKANDGLDDSGEATVDITVVAVNDAPSFTKGADQTADGNGGAQTVNGWATDISAGPPDESGQTLTFQVTNNNNGLFSAQPAVSPAGDLTYTPSANAYGVATVTVRLQDDGGTANGGVDMSPPRTFTVTLTDTAPPETMITGQPPNPSNSASAVFTFEGTDAGSGVEGYECSPDGAVFAACTSPVNLSGLSQGTHTFQVRARDNAGNRDPDPANCIWTVDTTAPSVNISAPSVSSTGTGPVTFTVTYIGADSVSLTAGHVTLNRTGTADGTVSVFGGSTAAPTISIGSISGEGTLSIGIAAGTATDTAGNTAPAAGPSDAFTVSNSMTYTLSVIPTTLTEGDSGAQTVTFTIIRGGATDAQGSVNFALSGTASEGTDYNNIRALGGTGVSYSAPVITFNAGATLAVITADVLGDATDEPDETLVGELSDGTASAGGTVTLSGSPATVTISDDDGRGVTVTPSGGLTTTESGGTATFMVVLTSQPAGDVRIPLSSDRTDECTVSPASLTFTPVNWNAPQIVTVTGVDDFVADGNQVCTIVTAPAESTDADYDGFDASDVSVTNTDDETAGITVFPTGGLTTTEWGGATTFTVLLNSQPTADVSIGLSSGNPGEGTVSPSTLTFTDANWNVPQTVTVTGVDDWVTDGNQVYTVVTAPAVSTDADYDGFNASDVSVTNTDDETAGITVSPVTGLRTTEWGGTDTFTVVLNTEPTANVVIGLSSGNTGEGTVSPASLTFTPANWRMCPGQ